MMWIREVILAGLLLLGLTAPAVRADSLWPADGSASALFTDVKARRVGDVLTVLISEQTQAVSQATTKTGKSEDASFSAGNIPLLKQLGKIGAGGSTNLNATGQTSRNGSLTGRITVVVKS